MDLASAPKYSRLEIERRWLVDLERVGALESLPSSRIEDLYLSGGRLRLRRVEGPGGEVIYKLGKKYGKGRGPAEPITNLYLTDEEYLGLAALRGHRASKLRYSLEGGSLDVYSSPRPGFAVFEVEFETEEDAGRYRPPAFVTDEITGDPACSGAAIAGAQPSSHT